MNDAVREPAGLPEAHALDDQVYRFLHTGRRTPALSLPGAQTRTVDVATPPGWRDGPEISLSVHVLGSGPEVLLVHGWRGQSLDMHPLAQRLAERGYRVWLPDLPGHGQSGGAHLSIPLAAAALQAVQGLAGEFSFAAGHSYGGASLVHAICQGLHARRMALLAPATHYGFFARRAILQAGLPQALAPAWVHRLAEIIGVDPDTVNLREQVQQIGVPALVTHSSDDDVVPAAALQSVIDAWPGATWMPREGLGHRGLLTDDSTLRTLCDFAGVL